MTRHNQNPLPPGKDFLAAELADPDRPFRQPDARLPKPQKPRKPEPEKPKGSPSTRILSWEASAAIHLGLVLLIVGLPQFNQPDPTQEDKKVETIPIEVAFEPQPVPPAPKVAPPAPQVKPKPEPVPQAVERPQAPMVRERAAAPKPLPPKAAVRQAVPAPKPAQKAYERPKAPDLQAALQDRINRGREQEEQRLSHLRDAARAGSDTAPKQTGSGIPQGNPQTDASGLSGALASRSPLRMPQPRYPMEAQRLGDEGSVKLRLYVDPDGGVSRVEVVRSSGRGYFDRAAASAARQWAFTPLDDPAGGEQWGEVTMYFRL